jgi:hypothetical protein
MAAAADAVRVRYGSLARDALFVEAPGRIIDGSPTPD